MIPIRRIDIRNKLFKDSNKFALRLIGKHDLRGLFVTHLTVDGPEVTLYNTLEEAIEASTHWNVGAVEIVEYVYERD